MYIRKKPEDLNCGIEVALKVFVGRWKPCILDSLRSANKRPSEIHRAIPSASPRVINIQLRELENYKLVSKIVYPGLPPKVEYHLTEMGRSVLPIINMMDEWGKRNRETVKKCNELLKVVAQIS